MREVRVDLDDQTMPERAVDEETKDGERVGSPPMNWTAGIPAAAMSSTTSSQSARVIVPWPAFGPDKVQQCEHSNWQRPVSSHSTERIPSAGEVFNPGLSMVMVMPSLSM